MENFPGSLPNLTGEMRMRPLDVACFMCIMMHNVNQTCTTPFLFLKPQMAINKHKLINII